MLKVLYEQREEQGSLTISGPCGTPLKCHKNILTSQSFFFESMFEFNDNMGQKVQLDF